MDMTMGQLVFVLRKRLSVPAEQAIFVFVNSTCVCLRAVRPCMPSMTPCVGMHAHRLPASSALMSNIYLKHKDEDGFLYIRYSGENAFGSVL